MPLGNLVNENAATIEETDALAIGLRLEDSKDVVLSNDEAVLSVDLHFGSVVFPEEHAVAGLHVELSNGAVFQDLAAAHGHHFALCGFFLGRVGDDDAPLALLFLF